MNVLMSEEKFHPIQGLSPLFPVHPGDILGEELKERGLSQKAFAESIGMQPSHLSALIHGARNFTRAVATKIADGLPGISAEYWMLMQSKARSCRWKSPFQMAWTAFLSGMERRRPYTAERTLLQFNKHLDAGEKVSGGKRVYLLTLK